MNYPQVDTLRYLLECVCLSVLQKHDLGAQGIDRIIKQAEKSITQIHGKLKKLPIDKKSVAQEPDTLAGIRRLRPQGPRKMWAKFVNEKYREKLEGALLARMAGCTLGAIVEGWDVERMEDFADLIGDKFPPEDYWTKAFDIYKTHYGVSKNWEFTRSRMRGVPVDDDVVYTVLGLLVAEEYGPDFTTDDVGKAWVRHLSGSELGQGLIKKLKSGVSARNAFNKDNPSFEWIGADIRADSWGYMAPGWPQKAAEMAYRDAFLTNRRNGIYGEMFFAAAIAAGFNVSHPVEAIEIGLTEIPKNCRLAQAIRWALRVGRDLKNYKDARKAVNERFAGMNRFHTINNACLTVFGLMIGGTNVTKVISQTVAMGLDNDCTAATAGSIAGAVAGKKGVEKHWFKNFQDTIHTCLPRTPKVSISGILRRFEAQAKRTWSS